MCALVTGVQTCALPILYGGIAARLANVPAFVAAISGLGYLFTRSRVRFDYVRWAAIGLYRLALGHANSRVIFQNTSDQDVLRKAGVVRSERSEEHTSELQSLMRHSYAVFCLNKKKSSRNKKYNTTT